MTAPMTVNRLATATSVKSGSTCTAVVDGTTVTLQCARDLTVAVGDVLFVSKFRAQWVAIARLYTAAPTLAEDNDTVPEPKPTTVSGTLVVPATDTVTWNGTTWVEGDVKQGSYGGGPNLTGAAFYGTKPTSLAGATAVSATLALRRLPRGLAFAAQAPTLRLITETSRPSGAPTLGSSTAGPALSPSGTNSAFDIPASWAQALIDGTAGGIGLFVSGGSPFIVLAGRSSWGPAFTLSIKWSR